MKIHSKKLLSIFLCLVIAFSAISATFIVYASNQPTLSVGNVEASTGDTVVVPVEISNNPGICTIGFEISYDTTKLSLVSAKNANVFANGTETFGGDIAAVPYKLMWDDSLNDDTKENGVIANLTFTVLDGASGKIDIDINFNTGDAYNFNMDDQDFETKNGSITVKQSTSVDPVEATLSSISVKKNPAKTVYEIGEALNTDGLVILATYSDGSTKEISTGFTTSGFSSATSGTKQVAVTYDGKTTNFDITVNEKTAVNEAKILIDNVSGKKGDTVQVPVKIINNPGIVAISFEISYDNSQLSLQSVKNGEVFANGTETFGGNVTAVPYKLMWEDGLNKNNTNNGTIAVLTFKILENAGNNIPISIIFVPNDGNTFDYDTNDVVFSAENGSVSVSNGASKVVSTIKIKSMPNVTNYKVGSKIDTTGLELTVVYTDGSKEDITSGFEVSGFSSNTPGKKTVTITYGGKTVTFDVDVYGSGSDLPQDEKKVTSISIVKEPNKKEYYIGEKFVEDGLAVNINYNDGTSEQLSSGYTIKGFDSKTIGKKTIVVSYEDFSDSFTIEVVKANSNSQNWLDRFTLALSKGIDFITNILKVFLDFLSKFIETVIEPIIVNISESSANS